MRENIGLFRAKDIKKKEWRDGYYWTNEVGNHFIRVVRDKNNNFITPIDYEIDPETLCECTGLKDKERQKVIAELEEWVEKASNNYISKFDINGQDALFLVKQKLNEMKEV